MIVRNFSAEDKSLFSELCREFYESNATMRGYNQEITEKTFERVIDNHENLWGFILSDADTQTPIGYALITSYWCNEEGGNVLVLDELYVSPHCRHKGYASMFIEWLGNQYGDKAVSITLEVLTTNTSARNLYAHEGFEPDGFITYTKKIGAAE